MSIFYKGAFKGVFFITSIMDKKQHKKNLQVEGVQTSVIRYLNDNSEDHLMNFIWSEKRDGKLPLVFDVHGGAWMYGDRNLNLDFGKYISSFGFNVALPTYRLAFNATLKEMVQDLFSSLNYLLVHAGELNIDANNIFLVGDSAGGHLVLLMATIAHSEKLQNLYQISRPVDVNAIVTCNPAPYLHDVIFLEKPKFMNKRAAKTFFKMLFTKKFEEDLTYKCSSFDEFIKETDEFPEVFITTSTGDKFVGKQATRLHSEMTSLGMKHEIFILNDDTYPHVFNITRPQEERSLKINSRIIDFLKKHIKENEEEQQED